jgi:hypothetical protein
MGLSEGLAAVLAAGARLIVEVDAFLVSLPSPDLERCNALFAATSHFQHCARHAEESAGDRPKLLAALRHVRDAGAALAPPLLGAPSHPVEFYVAHLAEHYPDLRSSFDQSLVWLLGFCELYAPPPAGPPSGAAPAEEASPGGTDSAARADSGADSGAKKQKILPDNIHVLQLAQRINRSKGGESQMDIARAYVIDEMGKEDPDDKIAQSLLRQIRRYPRLSE